MNIHPDFEELFQFLEKHHVEYMIVGGYAVAFHGYPRFTKDIDIFFERNSANVAAVRRALLDFGFTEDDLPIDIFLKPGNVITFGVAPSRVDLLNEIDGLEFADARRNIVRSRYGSVAVNFIGRMDLLKNKRATERAQDKVDANELDSP